MKNQKFLQQFISLTCLLFFAFVSIEVSVAAVDIRQGIEQELNPAAIEAGFTTSPPEQAEENLYGIIADVINIILGFLGIIFMILILWSGFQWMTAGGNKEAIAGAKSRIINATIGLAIVLAAYSIVWFITKQILRATVKV